MSAVGYLVNVFPAPSHAFIRREIDALRRVGASLRVLSLRQHAGLLPDAADRRLGEEAFVARSGSRALLSCLGWLARHPWRSSATLLRSLRMYGATPSGIRRAVGYLLLAARVARQAELFRIGHLHAQMGSNAAGVAHLCALLLPSLTYSLTIHGPEEFVPGAARRLRLAEKMQNALFTVAVTDGVAKRLCEIGGGAARSYRVRVGIDRAFTAGLDLAAAPSAVPTVCFVGRLCERKRAGWLLEACARLSGEWRLLLVGDGAERSAIEARARELGVTDRVEFTGYLSSEGVARSIQRARVVVLPSSDETLPSVIMEAFLLRRPVICTDVGSHGELVFEGENGWIVPPDDLQALSTALENALAQEPATLRRMGRKGADRVLQLHDADRQARELLELWRRHGVACR